MFLSVLLLMMIWEKFRPRRAPTVPIKLRWTSNLTISVLNVVVLRLVFPMLGLALAVTALDRGWGILNNAEIPGWIVLPVSLILLDLIIYWQHRLFHKIPLFWRLHRMHHTDLDFDTTTGVRFHPLEAVCSMIIKSLAIIVVGVSPLAFLLFEILLNGTSLFNHGNVTIPARIDGWLRWLIVTPDMHRVHHSVEPHELNRNFGFNLPWWDRLFGTYQAQPDAGHEAMQIGTHEFREQEEERLGRMLLQPFRLPSGTNL